MRILVLIILLGLQLGKLYAQPWRELLPAGKSKQELTYFDYQEAFYKYWEPFNVVEGYYTHNGERIKATGYNQFKRWEYWNKFRVNKKTGAFPARSAVDVVREHESRYPSHRNTEGDWKSIGPITAEGGFSGLGRINCVAFHPTDSLTLWCGAASGGLWVTYDGGLTWQCLTDRNESLGVSDIIIARDYDSSKTIYIATGDRDGIDNISVGVLKSTDGGATWMETGLAFELADFDFVNRLVIHPDNPQILYAATRDGLYKTEDAGATWDIELGTREYFDLEFHPTDPSIMYGATFDGEVYRSLNGGNSWTRTLFVVDAGRTEIAVSVDEPDWVYAIGVTGRLEGVYRSVDKGGSFIKMLDGDTLNLMDFNATGAGTGGQGWYDLAMAASPTDANTVFVGGINTWRTQDGGTTWSVVNTGGGPNGTAAHVDKHGIGFGPDGDVWECNDGGIYESTDGGATWNDMTNGMAIGQIYKLGVSASHPNEVIIGLQDNGSKLFSGGVWDDVGGGDGMECIIHPHDVNIQFTSSQYGNFFRTTNHWTQSRFVKPQLAGEGAWTTPYVMDPVDPNIIYAGFREVWKTTDRGDTWTQISAINANQKLEYMAIAPSDNHVIYISESNRMWKSVTGGEPFVRLPSSGPANSNQISYITVKHDDPQTVWVSVAGFWEPAVFQSADGGMTWEDISDGLPKIPVHTVIQNIQVTDAIELYAGTELGVYVKKGDAPWMPFNNGLPNVIVSELEFYYSSDPSQSLLRTSTYGRGTWETRVVFNSFPMELVSTDAAQSNTSTINPGMTTQEILKVEIRTSGDLEPLHVHRFTFSTEGSTEAANSITKAQLYYTANINSFQATDPFGEAVLLPDGEFVMEGDLALSGGSNYFWLTYDISQEASIGSFVDAACLSVHLNENIIPYTTHPVGSRQIDLTYCDAGSSNISQDHISHVVSDEVDQVSQKGFGGYEDYTGHVIGLEIGVQKVINVTNASPHGSNEMLAWVDWNRDGDFTDPDERQYDSGPLGISTYSVSITPPPTAKIGQTRLRMRLHDTNFGPNDQPCGLSNLGEVEDYTVDVKENMTSVNRALPVSIIHLFPNPVSDELHVPSWIPADASVQIWTVIGESLIQRSLDSRHSIGVRALAPDVYMVRIVVGDHIYLGRFSKL